MKISPDRPPIPGPFGWVIQVHRRSPNGLEVVGSATTSAGTTTLTAIPPGRYDVIVMTSLDLMARSHVLVAHFTDIDTRRGETSLEIAEDDLPASFARGRVIGASGHPVENARVIATRISTVFASAAEDTTGSDGRFAIGPLSRGDYSLRVEPSSGAPTFVGQHTLLPRRDEDVGDVRLR